MGQPLDNILKKDLIGSRDNDGTTNYETINVSGFSEAVDASGTEQGFTVTVDYANGSTPNVDFVMEVSTDGITYVPNGDTLTNIVDNSGTIIFDITSSNVDFVRVAWTVNSGSLDVYCRFSGKRRH